MRSYLLDTVRIVSFLGSRNIIFTLGASSWADFAALPPGIVLHVGKDPFELRAVLAVRCFWTHFLSQRCSEGGEGYSQQNIIYSD